jgi:hypothetical protein
MKFSVIDKYFILNRGIEFSILPSLPPGKVIGTAESFSPEATHTCTSNYNTINTMKYNTIILDTFLDY